MNESPTNNDPELDAKVFEAKQLFNTVSAMQWKGNMDLGITTRETLEILEIRKDLFNRIICVLNSGRLKVTVNPHTARNERQLERLQDAFAGMFDPSLFKAFEYGNGPYTETFQLWSKESGKPTPVPPFPDAVDEEHPWNTEGMVCKG
ncbi:hypothetical protein HN512_01090 [Candidatus Peregrinibacteria bacterium]|jgi:hypothetical protein|nr:hypothetical protein [Candidatus Peregrinibacteria bacterium]MBT3598414.1 hypothetical protein [Candidatus Peregrinibacteria bacterium]MBT4367594.1 hypothetical protein [Candidatus Peregrinibacteria bacterium]MBT4586236.1 hypothetical protein [Candidatus Peregrinibacteria bacterium]MBT6731070.1 hypothetical protein [Candidatus Peregrinibacteria bacterium]